MARTAAGRAAVKPGRAAHVKGIGQGNRKGSCGRTPGLLPGGRSTAPRPTGADPGHRAPVTPGTPDLSPS